MQGVEYRLQAFIKSSDQRSLIVDASAGLSLGALPGLENFTPAVRRIMPQVDGVVCSPGQINKFAGTTKEDAGLLVRVDWHNTLRSGEFVLPVIKPQRVPVLTAQDALDLGAVGMVMTFLLGYEEELEAACLHATVNLALDGKSLGMPLIVEVQASGPRVSLPGKAVELGVSYALEGGADVIVVPYPGRRSLETIGQFASVPWLLKPTSLDSALPELKEAISLGAQGLWIDFTLFAQPDPSGLLQSFYRNLHLISEPS